MGEAEAGSQRVQPSETTPFLRLWSTLPMSGTTSSLSRPHSSCLQRQLPQTGAGEHTEVEKGGFRELRVGGEVVEGKGSMRRFHSRLLSQGLQGRQPSLSLLTLPLWPTVSAICRPVGSEGSEFV